MAKSVASILALPFFFTMIGYSLSKIHGILKDERDMSIDEIWKIEDTNSFLIALTDHVSENVKMALT